MRFSIVTPCFNAEQFIGETIQSILGQTALRSGRTKLEYIIVDGQSTDRTLEIIKEQTADFKYGTVQIISERDHGMYDALAKGLKLTTGDICGYLNADDLYSPYAFDILLDVWEAYPSIDWLTGLQVTHNERSHMIHAHLPFIYRSKLIACGLYNGSTLDVIQQESTFWRREINRFVDFEDLSQIKLAGDYYLWRQFAQHADLKIVEAHLGGFRFRRGQLSENLSAYMAEMRSLANPPQWSDHALVLFDKISKQVPGRLSRRWRQKKILVFSPSTRQWIWQG